MTSAGSLRYLAEEIAVGLEIYCLGRAGGHTMKSAYVLCDDYAELASKLFLTSTEPSWTETKSSGKGFKSYHDVMKEVRGKVPPRDALVITAIQERMQERRARRNQFFHSTNLLDLSVGAVNVASAFADLLDYLRLLFGAEWSECVEAAPRAMATLEVLVRLDVAAVHDPAMPAKVSAVFAAEKRNSQKLPARGALVATHPADLHTVLAVTWGGKSLRERLEDLKA